MNLSNVDFELIAKIVLLLAWWALVHYTTMSTECFVDAFDKNLRI